MRYETERTGRRGHPNSTTDALARGLGVFSIALGLMEVAAPRALARFLGMKGSEALIRGSACARSRPGSASSPRTTRRSGSGAASPGTGSTLRR